MGKFLELEKVKIEDNKNLVFSVTDEGKISIAQQLVVKDGNREMNLFLKNSVVVDINRLSDIYKAIENVINKLSDNNNVMREAPGESRFKK
jgi:ribosome-associated translation inhibitor RaiA